MLRIALFIILQLGISIGAAAASDSCKDEIGEEQAANLVKWCIEVSPATHPPCNSSNSCQLIASEIKRGCMYLKKHNPPYYCHITYDNAHD